PGRGRRRRGSLRLADFRAGVCRQEFEPCLVSTLVGARASWFWRRHCMWVGRLRRLRVPEGAYGGGSVRGVDMDVLEPLDQCGAGFERFDVGCLLFGD